MFVVALLSSGVVSTQADDVKPGEQTAQTFEKQISVKLDYLLDLPADYEKTPDKKWPLIFFLHGSGERGSNVQKVAAHGPPRLLGADADKIDHSDKRNKDATDVVDVDEAKSKEAQAALKNFIVVSPQLSKSESGWQPFALNAMLDDILAKYHVDHDRVYLTGLSMGGYGTWQWASQNPGRFAAIAPMSGGGDPRRAARPLRRMPIWNFHGEADPTVPISESEKMVEAIEKGGNTDIKFTRYPNVGHNCWGVAYGNPELYSWFLSHTLQHPAGDQPSKTR